jgi:calcineurin-like phosphoesterase
MKVKVMCIGDIVGRPGRYILSQALKEPVRERSIDCVIANAENAAGGSGLTAQIFDKLLKYGIHLVTLGDHAYRKRDIIPTLESASNIVRPANLSPGAAGHDYAIYQTAKGTGGSGVPDRPSRSRPTASRQISSLDKLRARRTIFVEVHAEANGRRWRWVRPRSRVYGTHTHIVTATSTFSEGTAYITDIGMTGGDSVRRKTENIIGPSTQMPYPFRSPPTTCRSAASRSPMRRPAAAGGQRVQICESSQNLANFVTTPARVLYGSE